LEQSFQLVHLSAWFYVLRKKYLYFPFLTVRINPSEEKFSSGFRIIIFLEYFVRFTKQSNTIVGRELIKKLSKGLNNYICV